MPIRRALTGVCAAFALSAAAAAQDRGPVTNLPLPRFVSMKAPEGNVRRGPSLTHRIDWVFKQENIPLEITAEHGHWRRVRDLDGAGGWMHYSLLSGVRTAIADEDMLPLHATQDGQSPVIARLELGVVADIESCTRDWCRLSVAGYEGWARKSGIWGVRDNELLD
ncbi:SH3 domain-containing protein [Roseovarius salis]|uniref:SH3 domain-containing protein n=1 Tax=Roseovarius salis TaxID=3376063 RepID=UPI0037C85CC0